MNIRSLFFLFAFALIFSNCDPASSTNSKPEFRISGQQFSVGFTHNSHFGRGFSNPESAYSPVITFEIFLTESTDYTEISGFAILDDAGEGWTFTHEEVQNAYNADNNSLIFEDLELRKFDAVGGTIVKAKFLDENNEVIRETGFELDNNFPLPALTSITNADSNGITVFLDFYKTPYDGGNIKFSVTIYNTFYSSNSFYITWLDDNNQTIGEDYLDKNSMTDVGLDDWNLFLSKDSIPEGATKFYTTFRRGWYTRGGVLHTQIIDLPSLN